MWMFFALAFGVIKGIREIVKKESMKKNTIMEVLLLYTLLSFLFVSPGLKESISVHPTTILVIAIKSFCVFCTWILSFYAISNMPISLYGVLDLYRVLFSTLLAIIVLNERLVFASTLGLILVSLGLLLLRNPFIKTKEKVSPVIIILAIISCFLNAVSGLLDKILMKDLTSAQLQFWYMLFLVMYYALYFVFTRTKVNFVSSIKNYWIWILALLLVIGDRCLFIANGYPDSRITIMTILKQSSCIITIIAGKFLYKEKDIVHKFICAVIIICGIVISAVYT